MTPQQLWIRLKALATIDLSSHDEQAIKLIEEALQASYDEGYYEGEVTGEANALP